MSIIEKLNEVNSLLQDLGDITTGQKGRDLLLARKVNNGGIGDDSNFEYDFSRIKIDDEISNQLEELVRDKVQTKLESLQSNHKRLVDYDIQNRHRDEDVIEYLSAESLPRFEDFGRLLEGQRFSSTTYREPPKPEFQAIRVHHSDLDGKIVGFLNYRRDQILGRTSRVRMKVGSTKHSSVDESLMGIPNRLDALYYEGDVFVFNHSHFESAFDYMDQYLEQADETLDELREGDIPFDDFDLFADAVRSNPNALRLLQEVHERGVYTELGPEDAELIQEEFDTEVEFVEKDDGSHAIFMENKLDVWKVLRFFNDDHLLSPLTEQGYVSLSKEDATTAE